MGVKKMRRFRKARDNRFALTTLQNPLCVTSTPARSGRKNLRAHLQAAANTGKEASRHVSRGDVARITSQESRMTKHDSLINHHHSGITPFLIGFSAIRNRRNQMKTNGGLPF
jgi:hypothetical protein